VEAVEIAEKQPTVKRPNLIRTLREGGAEASLCSANPLSTQDEVAAALARGGVEVRARRGESRGFSSPTVSRPLQA